MFQFLSDLIMGRFVRRFLLGTGVERFRARVPYFVVTGFVAAAYCLPAAALIGLAQLLGYRGTPEVSLTRSWLTIGLAPFGIAAGFAVLTAVSWVSGYRPFRKQWTQRNATDLAKLSDALRVAAEAQGFETVWRGSNADPHHNGFVAVRGIDLERRHLGVHPGKSFPMRLSLFVTHPAPGPAEATLTLTGRTLVLWDTGERSTCEQIGRAVVAAAGAE